MESWSYKPYPNSLLNEEFCQISLQILGQTRVRLICTQDQGSLSHLDGSGIRWYPTWIRRFAPDGQGDMSLKDESQSEEKTLGEIMVELLKVHPGQSMNRPVLIIVRWMQRSPFSTAVSMPAGLP